MRSKVCISIQIFKLNLNFPCHENHLISKAHAKHNKIKKILHL